MHLEWIDCKKVIVVGLNLTVLIPELGKIGSGFENDWDWLGEANDDVFHDEVEDVEHNHRLSVSEEAQTVEEVIQAGGDQGDRDCDWEGGVQRWKTRDLSLCLSGHYSLEIPF